jgi:hypothetical protein
MNSESMISTIYSLVIGEVKKYPPRVAFHKVGIVFGNSYKDMVNPYTLLFCCINRNGSSSSWQKNLTLGLWTE